jgi:hypothetical protein
MNGLWSFDEPQPQSPRSWQRWIWWTRGLVDFTAEVSEESPLSPVLAVIGSRRRTTMFARISLALTMLLGSGWALLAQNYVSQMTPRIRYCGFGAHRIQCCQPVRRAKCRAGRAVSNIYEGQCRCGAAIPAAVDAARAELCEQDNQLDESLTRTINMATRIDHDHLLLQRDHRPRRA